jgi:hypothetical protein
VRTSGRGLRDCCGNIHQGSQSDLLRATLRGEVCQSDYEEGNVEFSCEIRETEKELRALDLTNGNRDAFLQFCELALVDIPQVWRTANEDQRRRVRTILFPEGILVGADRKISNPQNSSLFNVLAGMMAKKPQFSKVGCPPGIRPRYADPESWTADSRMSCYHLLSP